MVTERKMLTCLKLNCGLVSIEKVEGMLTDLELAKIVIEKY